MLGVVTGFNNYDILAEKHRLMQEFIFSEGNNELYREQLISSYISKITKSMLDAAILKKRVESVTKTVDIKEVKELGYVLDNYIAKNMPPEEFTIEGFNVGRLIVLPIMYGPILILGLILLTILQIRKLHTILVPMASPDSEMQLKLNSIYFDRITTHYKHRWRFHVLSFGLIILFLTLLGPIIFMSARTFVRLDTTIEINNKGDIKGSPQLHNTPLLLDVELTEVKHGAVLVLITMALWISLVLISVRVPYFVGKHTQKEIPTVKAGVEAEDQPDISQERDAPRTVRLSAQAVNSKFNFPNFSQL